MGRIFQCVGRYAGTAYTIKNTYIRVYCVEELCYYICNNAYLLDESFACPELADWLEEECSLPDLAGRLRERLRSGDRLEGFAEEILSSTNYVTSEESGDIRRVIVATRHTSKAQKEYVLAEHFLKNHRYALAFKSYQHLLNEFSEALTLETRARIYYHLGVVYSGMFCFEQADSYFEKAFSMVDLDEYRYASYVAKKMYLTEKEYRKYRMITQDFAYISDQVEKDMETAENEWLVSEEYRRMRRLQGLMDQGNIDEYELGMDAETEYIKETYRNCMSE